MQKISAETRRLVGGALCLDFANSIDWASDGTERPAHTDVLTEPQHLGSWGQRVELFGADAPLPVSGRELSAARELRSAVRSVFAAIAKGSVPSADALARIERDHAKAAHAGHLVQEGGHWGLDWPLDDPRRVRFAVALDAMDMLREEERLERLRICPGNNCGWLFLDSSGRRRWCSMEVCGSRAKMRRLYQRKVGGRPGGRPPTGAA